MLVKELIKELQKWDDDTKVCIGVDKNQWAETLKMVTRDLYYSDGSNYCAEKIKEDGLTEKEIIILLRYQ